MGEIHGSISPDIREPESGALLALPEKLTLQNLCCLNIT